MEQPAMASFIIDNGGRYSDHAVYFVEAPLSFEKWFNGTLLTWLEAHDMHGEKLHIVGVAPTITWREGGIMSFTDFLDDDTIVEQIDYSDSPSSPRPHYEREPPAR
jgi:hypothetical protein